MAGITLAQAEAQLTAWLAASTAVAAGQSYSISVGSSSRSLSRADAKEIREMLTYWGGQVDKLTGIAAGRGKTRYVVPV